MRLSRAIAVLASSTIMFTASAAGAQASKEERSAKTPTGVTAVADESALGGPAPDWFKDPAFQPVEPMPEPEMESKRNAAGNREAEVLVYMPYCRDVYGHMYWMSTSANLATCTQGYVKYYDSRNGDYLAFYDVYGHYWKMTRSTALTTAYNWCTSNFICSIALETFLLSKVKPVWTTVRSIRFGL